MGTQVITAQQARERYIKWVKAHQALEERSKNPYEITDRERLLLAQALDRLVNTMSLTDVEGHCIIAWLVKDMGIYPERNNADEAYQELAHVILKLAKGILYGYKLDLHYHPNPHIGWMLYIRWGKYRIVEWFYKLFK